MSATAEPILKDRARRGYELGRLISKLPWGFAAAPFAILSLHYCAHPGLAMIQSALLAVSIVAMLWLGRDFAKALLPGLACGVPGFAIPYFCCASGACPVGPSTQLVAICFGGSVLAGLLLSAFAIRRRLSLPALVSAITVAGLMVTLGCSVAGLGGVLGAALGVMLATTPALLFAHR